MLALVLVVSTTGGASAVSTPASPNICLGDASLSCPAWPSANGASVCDRDDNACANCFACLEAFHFATVPGLPNGYGIASRKKLASNPDGHLVLRGDKRGYLVSTTKAHPAHWADVELVKLHLKQHTLRIGLDVSGVGCACNAAHYLVNMHPASEFLPQSSRGVGPVYCDVQGPTNTSVLYPSKQHFCIEDDLVESNTKAFQSTLHTAFAHPGPGHGDSCTECDQWGWKSCGNGLGTFVEGRYGLHASVIDSFKPFEVVAGYDDDARKFIGLRQGGGPHRTLGVWNTTWTKDGDCAGSHVPEKCYQTLSETLETDGLAMVLSLWKDNATKMSWLNGECDATYPECDLSSARFVIQRIEIDNGFAPFGSDTSATCRLNIPYQCCYDSGLGACTVPSDGSQYCDESAANCITSCGGKEFCHCKDAHGAGCDKSWFVPGARGADHQRSVECDTSAAVVTTVEEAEGTPPRVRVHSTNAHARAPCYQGRAHDMGGECA